MVERKPHRRDFEILADVLKSCPTWTKQTCVILSGFSRWTDSKKMCYDLERRGLLESRIVDRIVRGRTRHALSETPQSRSFLEYRRTSKGSDFLRLCKLLIAIWTINTRTQNESKL